VALDVDTDVFHVSRSRELGLDPLKLFESKDVALSLLTDTLNISGDEPELLSTLRNTPSEVDRWTSSKKA